MNDFTKLLATLTIICILFSFLPTTDAVPSMIHRWRITAEIVEVNTTEPSGLCPHIIYLKIKIINSTILANTTTNFEKNMELWVELQRDKTELVRGDKISTILYYQFDEHGECYWIESDKRYIEAFKCKTLPQIDGNISTGEWDDTLLYIYSLHPLSLNATSEVTQITLEIKYNDTDVYFLLSASNYSQNHTFFLFVDCDNNNTSAYRCWLPCESGISGPGQIVVAGSGGVDANNWEYMIQRFFYPVGVNSSNGEYAAEFSIDRIDMNTSGFGFNIIYATPYHISSNDSQYGFVVRYNGSGIADYYEIDKYIDVCFVHEYLNRPPVITNYSIPANFTLKEGENFTFNVSAIDLDMQNLTYTWYLDNVSVSNSINYTFQTNYTSAGTHNVTVIVSDGESDTTHLWNIIVINNTTTNQTTNQTGNQTQTNNTNTTNNQTTSDNKKEKGFVSGFETVAFICSIGTSVVLYRKRKLK